MSLSQGQSRINPIPRIDTISLRSSHLSLGLPKGLFPVGIPVKILKVLLPSSILSTCPAHLKDYVTTLLKFKSVAYISQGSHTAPLDSCN